MSSNKHELVKEILYTNEEIEKGTKELSVEVNNYYKNLDAKGDVTVIGVLFGCIPFFSVLLKNLDFDCEIDFCRVSSFGGGEAAVGEPKLLFDVERDVKGKHVLLVEDIVDSGHSIAFLKDHYLKLGAVDVKICSLLDKKENRVADVKPDFYVFDVKNVFLIGFGLDYQEKLRNLDYVAECDREKLKDWKW